MAISRRKIIRIVLCLAFAGQAFAAFALQPPEGGQLEQYKKDGSLAGRIAAARDLGNNIPSPALAAKLKRQAEIIRLMSQGYTKDRAASFAPPPAWKGFPTTGNRKMFILLIDFDEYSAAYSSSAVNSMIFGDGSAVPPFDSLKNFYARSSYGKLNISGATLGWYHAGPRSAVAESTSGREALIEKALTSFSGHDFAQYDNDGDGTIEYFAVIWTGPKGPWASFWWGYYTGFSDHAFTVGGKKLSQYSWQWEDNSPKVMIHETGHALGVPDYYDYNADVGPKGGVGKLDIMDGNWGDHNCFSKFMLDWLTPGYYDTGTQTITLRPSDAYGESVKIIKGGSASNPFEEFFMVQNRKREGNDSTYPADGLLVWHVDARLDAQNYDFLYDNSYSAHKLLRLMEADGLEEIEKGGSANAGDFYSAGKSFGPGTAPNSNKYDGAVTGVFVNSISEAAGIITFNTGFDFAFSTELLPAAGAIGTSSLTFTWNSLPGAQYIAVLSTSANYSNPVSSGTETVSSRSFTGLSSGETYWFEVKLSTEPDAAYAHNRLSARTTPPPLAEALDAPALAWTTGGGARWEGQSAVSVYGGSAAKSGSISNLQNSYLQTAVAGPGELAFYWKVSSEANYDYLSFYIDGALKTRISGSGNWEQVISSGLAAGQHTIKWEYAKDDYVAIGSDAGWLDKVEWRPTTPLSPAAVQVSSLSITAGWTPVTGAVYTAVLAADAAYSAILSSFPLTAGATAFSGLSPDTTYYFEVKISSEINSAFLLNRFSARTSSPSPPSLAEALDAPAFAWATGGSADWAGQSAVSLYGGSAARSGPVADLQNSYLQTTVTGPGELAFYWKVSSEANYDYLSFYIDGALKTRISGSRDWEQAFSSGIPAGQHLIKWEYAKNGGASSGLDAGWLDKVEWRPTTPLSPAAALISSQSITAGWTPVAGAGYTAVLAADAAYSAILSSFPLTAGATAFSGLSPDTAYYFEVKISTEIDGAFYLNRISVKTSPPPPPDSPGYFYGEAVSAASIRWLWADVSSEAGYRVLASTGGSLSGSLAADTISWTETGLGANTAYSREIVAYNSEGESVPVSSSAYTLAAPPASVSAGALGRTGIRVSWDVAGNPAETVYELEYSSEPAAYWKKISTDSAAVELTGLLPGKAYYSKVRALNGAGLPTAYTDGGPAFTFPGPVVSSVSGISSGAKMQLVIKGSGFYAGDRVRLERAGQAAAGAEDPPAVKQDHSELSAVVGLDGLAAGAWDVVVYNADGSDSGASGSGLFSVSAVEPGGAVTQALIDSAITSTITIAGGLERIIVPPGDIPNGYILVSTDPEVNPLAVSPAALLAAGRALPHGYLVLNMREYAAYSNGAPLNGFAEPVTIVISYRDDSPDDGIVDGTGVPELALKLAVLDEAEAKWVEVPAGEYFIDTAANTVTAGRSHFSVYALLGGIMAGNGSRVKVYPVPWQPGSGGRFGSAYVAGCGAGLIFDDLGGEGLIRIYTLPGDLVRELAFSAADNGCKSWDGRNAAGRNSASGIYLAVIKSKGGGSTVKKLAIER